MIYMQIHTVHDVQNDTKSSIDLFQAKINYITNKEFYFFTLQF